MLATMSSTDQWQWAAIVAVAVLSLVPWARRRG